MIAALLAAATMQVAPVPPTLLVGADVHRVCRSRDAADQSYCYGFVFGVHNTFRDLEELTNGFQIGYCLPERVTVGEVTEAVAEHVGASENLWSVRASSAVMLSLMDLYPCTTSGE